MQPACVPKYRGVENPAFATPIRIARSGSAARRAFLFRLDQSGCKVSAVLARALSEREKRGAVAGERKFYQ